MKPTRTFRWIALGCWAFMSLSRGRLPPVSLEAGYKGRLSLTAYSQALAEAGLGTSLLTSVKVAAGAAAITLALLVRQSSLSTCAFPVGGPCSTP